MSKNEISEDKSIIFKSLDTVLHDSMIPYTEHVVMDRALPRVEDGLKPVQRRILYSMVELNLTPDKQYRKSARIVGDCMGKYHPHGDSSVYDAMVRMAQDFSLREPLVDGHGNFGSIDGDGAAAMRYTEARMAPLALEMLRDLDKNTVSWSLNFDDTLKEPNMLPSRFPNILVNGAYGIAVGVATNIPPHNLSEVIDGVCEYIHNKKITTEEMMQIIKGPDFPTGGIIISGTGLKEAYETGKGKFLVRAKVHMETEGDKSQIVIDEIPYQQNKALLLQKIVELREKEKGLLSYIGEIRDESDRNGMRAVIKIKKDGNATAILNYLYKNTTLETTFGVNMVAIADGKPKLMGLMEIISYYVEYQVGIIVRRTQFDLDNALARAHIIKGLLIAIANIDEVIAIIKASQSVAEAKQRLIQRFELDDIQAQAILDMRIARLVNLEVKKLQEEYEDLLKKIEEYQKILASRKLQENIVASELKDIKKRFGNPRKTALIEETEHQEAMAEVVLEEYTELNYVLLSADGRLKRVVVKNLGGKAMSDPNALFEVNTQCIKVNDNEAFWAFTNKGNCARIPVKSLPLGQWKFRGANLNEIVKNVDAEEYIVKILPILENKQNLIFFTKNGLGKRSSVEDYLINRPMFLAMTLKDDDELAFVDYENDFEYAVIVSKMGYSLKIKTEEILIQRRVAVGIKLIKLEDKDSVVFASQVDKVGSLTLIANNGMAKKVPIGDFEPMVRYRKGMRTFAFEKDSQFIIYGEFNSNKLVLISKNKLSSISSDKIKYEVRISKGKLLEKSGITEVYPLLDKSDV